MLPHNTCLLLAGSTWDAIPLLDPSEKTTIFLGCMTICFVGIACTSFFFTREYKYDKHGRDYTCYTETHKLEFAKELLAIQNSVHDYWCKYESRYPRANYYLNPTFYDRVERDVSAVYEKPAEYHTLEFVPIPEIIELFKRLRAKQEIGERGTRGILQKIKEGTTG